jgi:hypothetical protein
MTALERERKLEDLDQDIRDHIARETQNNIGANTYIFSMVDALVLRVIKKCRGARIVSNWTDIPSRDAQVRSARNSIALGLGRRARI